METRDELNCKMEDIELQLKAELLRPLGKIPKKGVENWLKAVKEMIREAQVVENKVGNGRYLCRACNGKLVDEKTREMKEFLDNAPNASEGLTMDGPSAGLLLLTSELDGEEAVRNEIWACLMQEEVNAALTNEDTCMDGFLSRAMNGYAKMMVRKRIIKITQLTSNVLALTNDYSSSQILH
ncbi:hypothetical protein ES332_D05G412300v1 [Gossypium tomentosum]|uniref:Pectinesterase inhibitor domain-containing protein n=1 Tax=Gossypium tomentosum TaxID=34277 RepID=A0A5D2L905_GOSTO|nr:hypothetical protein ES332_D05G412300v1 [Gossypium tomentosum]